MFQKYNQIFFLSESNNSQISLSTINQVDATRVKQALEASPTPHLVDEIILNETELNLSNNHIVDIHPELICSISNLTEINLKKNNLKWLAPNVFSNLFQIKRIIVNIAL